MKRYVLDVIIEHTTPHYWTNSMKFDHKRNVVRKYYIQYVIPFAEQHNLNYKREEWRFGISLKKDDLTALTLILPSEARLLQDTE